MGRKIKIGNTGMQAIQPYQEFSGVVCVAAPAITTQGIASLDLWKKWAKIANRSTQKFITRAGGNGRPSLIEFSAIPAPYREKIIATFGNPKKTHNPLEKFFEIDGSARMEYDKYTDEFGDLTKEQKLQYTINASVLNALKLLKRDRETLRKRSGGNSRNVWSSLIADLVNFENYLKNQFGCSHSLPTSEKRLSRKLSDYNKNGYTALISGKRGNTNNQKVTPEMIGLWNDMFAGRRFKPAHTEVAYEYRQFLAGALQVINAETGECYDSKAECFIEVSKSSIYGYLSDWENRIVNYSKRAGDKHRFIGSKIPNGRMLPTEFAGSIISVDDRQPPFKYADGTGNRMWFYIAQDLGSEAFTAWVWGDSKEGIITEFYKELVRKYAEHGVNLPAECECEMSLNASFTKTFLQNGAMFERVRMIPNRAWTKRIERSNLEFRRTERKEEGFIARHHAVDENFQSITAKEPVRSKKDIIQIQLREIYEHNNSLHSNQELYPNMTRWQVFKEKQHPKVKPTNWKGILPHLGNTDKTSMKQGRITLQYKDRVVGVDGKVALGETLIGIMSQIEGREVQVRWIADKNGNVLKALVYDMSDEYVCELLDDLPYHRAFVEQTPQCLKNMHLTERYKKTVDEFIKQGEQRINRVEIIENKKLPSTLFQIDELEMYEPTEREAEVLDTTETEAPQPVYTSKKLSFDNF